jgi:lysophospholipase L1-like esterase
MSAGLSFLTLAALVIGVTSPARAQPEAEVARASAAASESSSGSAAIAETPDVQIPEAEALGVHVPIEDASGRVLARLHDALVRAEQGRGAARLLFYGASHTASDQYTGYLRRRLQSRFGDAGHGFVLPVRPFAYYDHRDVRIESRGRWRTIAVRGRDRDPGAYGLAGVAVETSTRATAVVEPSRATGRGSLVKSFEVYYLRQPRGGTFDLRLDGRRVARISTAAPGRELGYERVEAEVEGPHRLEIRAHGDGRVRLFGVQMEREAAGVMVSPFGVPGARARDQLPWDEAVQAEHLRRQDPDLVVLAYGTNETGFSGVSMDTYEGYARQVLERIRRAVPEASCLLIGPSEWPQRVGGAWVSNPRTAEITETQRRLAREHGCGFFDLVAFLGGPGSMERWVRSDPPMALEDRVHYTEHGHQRLAEVLEATLLAGLDDAASRRP